MAIDLDELERNAQKWQAIEAAPLVTLSAATVLELVRLARVGQRSSELLADWDRRSDDGWHRAALGCRDELAAALRPSSPQPDDLGSLQGDGDESSKDKG